MIPPYPPMTFLVICVFGKKTISIQRYCGPNVANENACLILALVSMSKDDSREEEDSMMDVGSIMYRADEDIDDGINVLKPLLDLGFAVFNTCSLFGCNEGICCTGENEDAN